MTEKKKMRKQRVPDDNYPTPDWAIVRFLETGLVTPDMSILEPCAGDGAIIHTTNGWLEHQLPDVPEADRTPDWTVYELRRECKAELRRQRGVDELTIGSFLSRADAIEPNSFDMALTNPPFVLAIEFVQACWSRVKLVCFLLRIGFLASQDRYGWMSQHVPDIYMLPNRPGFRWDTTGTDSQEYAWFVWDTSIEKRTKGELYLLSDTPRTVRMESRRRRAAEYMARVNRSAASRKKRSC